MKRIAKDTPVRVHDPRGVNSQYKNHLGIVKESERLLGGWSYKVRLNSGRVVWFDGSELRPLSNT